MGRGKKKKREKETGRQTGRKTEIQTDRQRDKKEILKIWEVKRDEQKRIDMNER